jgi:hypothetical protein
MQSLFPRPTSLPQVAALEWRVSALVLIAALTSASQGCGIMSDAPNRAVSTRGVSPPESQTGNPSIDKPQTHAFPREIPPPAAIPSFPETDEARHSQRPQHLWNQPWWRPVWPRGTGEDFTVSSPRAEKFLTRRNSRLLIELSPGVAE